MTVCVEMPGSWYLYPKPVVDLSTVSEADVDAAFVDNHPPRPNTPGARRRARYAIALGRACGLQ